MSDSKHPLCERFGLTVVERIYSPIGYPGVKQEFVISADNVEAFLAAGVEVEAYKGFKFDKDGWIAHEVGTSLDTHNGLLVGITPLKQPDAESLLRELVEDINSSNIIEYRGGCLPPKQPSALNKARAYIAAKDGK